MKKIFTILTIFLSIFYASAKQIDENTAKQVGQNFLLSISTSPTLNSTSSLELVYTNNSKISGQSLSVKPLNYFYIYNTNTNGFIIIAADDVVTPIIGYSEEGRFDAQNIPQSVAKWFEGYKNQIRYAIENLLEPTEEISIKWEELITGKKSDIPSISSAGVNPLLKTTWDQSPYYNSLCPGGSVTGCVATAMAQIMNYWNYPATGSGFHSYKHSKYGTISANFGTTTYDWSSMPNRVTSTNNAVAILMFHCGVSVDMNYSPQSSGAAGAITVAPALKTYFGYPSSVKMLERKNYSTSDWITLLKNELNTGNPMYYEGTGNGGHAFVCDGYDNNDFFHFNWGWDGLANGFYNINALNPTSLGTGAGYGEYNSNQKIVLGIEPPAGTQTYSLEIYDDVTPSQTTIGYGQAFSISTNIANSGTNTFNGDYAAAIFDKDYNFVEFVETLSGYSLKGGFAYSNNLEFSTTGLFSMLPGKYYIGIFYRPTGENWVQVEDGNYVNLIQMTVVHKNNIELNSNMVVTPGNTLTQGKPASVNLNFVNNGATTFKGQYTVALYNLDGTFAQIINTIDDNNGLPSGYTYQTPYLTFSTTAITVAPGTYLLAAQHNLNNTGWQLSGSTNFLNPIKVTVVAPALIPDKYETNDAIGQSYNLAISFSGNTANVNSEGSNCHITSDNDFYKIVLPSGFNYTLTPRIHDASNSGNGKTYTLDGLFSYSTDGNTWSDAYDDIMAGDIKVNGAKTIYFRIAPYFAGETGTYLLDMNINRISTANIEDKITDFVKIYPNPSKDNITIDYDNFIGEINNVSILNIQGQCVYSISELGIDKKVKINVENLPQGFYFVQLQSNKGIITQKIIIEK